MPAFLGSCVTAAHLRLEGISPSDSDLFMMAVIGCRSVSMHLLRSQVGSRSKSCHLFGGLRINSFISLSEAGWNTCSFSPLILLSSLVEILHKSPLEVHNKSSRMPVAFLMKKWSKLTCQLFSWGVTLLHHICVIAYQIPGQSEELFFILSTFYYFYSVGSALYVD